MRSIRVSEEVWQAIAGRGKFGETEDDVLRRVLDLPQNSAEEINTLTGSAGGSYRASTVRSRSMAKQRMSSNIGNNQLYIEFQDGASSSWILPERKDKTGIRAVLTKALQFARDNEASLGQRNAVRKTLTDEGYHLTK